MEFLQEIHDEVLCHYDVLTVGETPAVTPEIAIQFAREGQGPFSMVFQFEHMDLDSDLTAPVPKWTVKPWHLQDLRDTLTRWQKGMAGQSWNSLYLGNHDVPRLVSRFGDAEKHRYESATLLATLIHLQQGTPYIYQGDEIDMTNAPFDRIEDYRDVDTLNFYHEQVNQKGRCPAEVMHILHHKSRDHVLGGMYTIIRSLGLFNTYLGLILSYNAFSLPFTVWVLTSFVRDLPTELEEAAVVDGASPLQTLFKVLLPVMTPALITTGMLGFINAWNEFLFALTFTSDDRVRTVPVAIGTFSGGSVYENPFGQIMAASVVVTIPLILMVLFFQKRIVSGLTAGAVKG